MASNMLALYKLIQQVIMENFQETLKKKLLAKVINLIDKELKKDLEQKTKDLAVNISASIFHVANKENGLIAKTFEEFKNNIINTHHELIDHPEIKAHIYDILQDTTIKTLEITSQ